MGCGVGVEVGTRGDVCVIWMGIRKGDIGSWGEKQFQGYWRLRSVSHSGFIWLILGGMVIK
jgi:hypothetical protein